MTCGSANRTTMQRVGLALAGLLFSGAAQAQQTNGEWSTSVPPESLQVNSGPDSTFTGSFGVSGWSGDFGAPTNTDISSVITSVRYQNGGLRLSALIPRMRIESNGSFFAGIGGTPLFVAPEVRAPRRVRKGWGDLTLGASYLLSGGEQRGFDVDLTGRVKLPTASDGSELSTGKVDYSAGVEVSKTVGRFIPTASVTYRIFGDNKVWRFRNGFDVTAGASYIVAPSTAIVLNYEYVAASSRFIDDSHEVVLGASTPILPRLRLTAYGSKGLSDGAADVSGGVSLALTF